MDSFSKYLQDSKFEDKKFHEWESNKQLVISFCFPQTQTIHKMLIVSYLAKPRCFKNISLFVIQNSLNKQRDLDSEQAVFSRTKYSACKNENKKEGNITVFVIYSHIYQVSDSALSE